MKFSFEVGSVESFLTVQLGKVNVVMRFDRKKVRKFFIRCKFEIHSQFICNNIFCPSYLAECGVFADLATLLRSCHSRPAAQPRPEQ